MRMEAISIRRALITVMGLAGAAGVSLRLPALSGWSTADLGAMCVLVGATLVGESFTLKARYGSETKHISMTEAAYAAALLTGIRPSVLTVAVALGIGATDVARGTAPHETVFDVGRWLASITCAEVVFAGLRGASPAVAVIAAIVVLSAINAIANVGAITLATGRSFGQVLRPIATLETGQAAGTLALGAAAAALWATAPAGLAVLAIVVPAIAYASSRVLRPTEGGTTA